MITARCTGRKKSPQCPGMTRGNPRVQRTPGPTNIQRADTNTDLWQVSMREMGDLFKCLTVFNIEINVPILLLSQFSQLHKCRVIVVKMFRVRVEVVNPPPGFEVTEANKARTCLLYTSPSPRDLSTSRMPSSA